MDYASYETIITELQIKLNEDVYQMGRISKDVYIKMNNHLHQKLTKYQREDRVYYHLFLEATGDKQ